MPQLAIVRDDAPQREYDRREAFNAVRFVVRSGCPRRVLPNDRPAFTVADPLARRWMAAGVFEAIACDLRAILRLASDRQPHPTETILAGIRGNRRPSAAGGRGPTGPTG